MRLSLAVLALLALVAMFWWARADTDPTSGLDPDGTPHAADQTGAAAAATKNAGGTREALRSEDTGATVERKNKIRVRGRCVDEAGAPIANVVVHASGMREHAWTTPFPEIPDQRTDADGRFEMWIDRLPTWILKLSLRTPEFVALTGYWFGITKDIDLGDIEMGKGCRLSGRVRDSRGEPIAGMKVLLGGFEWDGKVGIVPSAVEETVTKDDGSFQLPRFARGKTTIWVPRSVQRTQRTIELTKAEQHLEIVVESPEDWPSIRGRVVDMNGRGIAGAHLHPKPRLTGNTIVTAKDGSFLIMKPARKTAEQIELHGFALGFTHLKTAQPIAWGTRDVELAMLPTTAIDLTVRAGGAPLENYKVWIAADPKHRSPHRLKFERIRSAGTHPGGRTEITGLPDGPYRLKVLPQDAKWAESEFVPVRIDGAARPPLVIELSPAIERRVLVRHHAGAPVTGAKVELLQSLDGSKPNANSDVLRRGDALGDHPYLRFATKTDAAGQARLRGPSTGTFSVRVSGRQIATKVVHDVDLRTTDPLVIELEPSAAVTLRLRPLEFVRQLGEIRPEATTMQPGVVLSSRIPGTRRARTVPNGRTERRVVEIDANGECHFPAVPIGDWEVGVDYVMKIPWGLARKQLNVGWVRGLRNGESRTETIELGHLLFARLKVRCHLDGKPVANQSVWLRSTKELEILQPQEDGSSFAIVAPKTYIATIKVEHTNFFADRKVTVVAGKDADIRLDFASRMVEFTFVGADGKPRRPQRVWLRRTDLGPSMQVGMVARPVPHRLPTGKLALAVGPKGKHREDDAVHVTDIVVHKARSTNDGPQAIRVVLPDDLGY